MSGQGAATKSWGFVKIEIGDLFMVGGGYVPLPTIFLQVSGRNSRIRTKHAPDMIVRSQKIHLQPTVPASAPPRMGPRLVAEFGL
jgi:hypothetical protein